jgi:hypothetical protein
MMNTAAGELHPEWQPHYLWASDTTNSFVARQTLAVRELKEGRSLVAMFGTVSGADSPGRWFSWYQSDWLDDSLQGTGGMTNFVAPTCRVTQCDGSGALETMWKKVMPIAEGGALSVVGPTRGHYTTYYYQYLREFFRQYSDWPGHVEGRNPTIGELHMNTKNALLSAAPTDSAMVILCQEMILLGDPTTEVWGPLGENYIAAVPGDGIGPRKFLLGAPRPNPFNPQTHISFAVPEPGRVDLRVYNIAGRVVSVLVDRDLLAGTHEAVWDGRTDAGRDAGSGVYFYRLQAGGKAETRRMVLIR